jgi:uncharacterized protein YaeQ
MALSATLYHFEVELSDVDRAVYATLDLRVARHPSEGPRYLLTRTLAYCLSYEEGIAFSKGGLSASDEPPVAIWDPTGGMTAWIDVGAPSAKRLHKATKSTRRVALFSHVALPLLIAEATSAPVFRLEEIEVWPLDAAFVDDVAGKLDRKLALGITRSDGALYVTLGGQTYEASLALARLTGGEAERGGPP